MANDVTSDALALNFTRLTRNKPPSSALPFTLQDVPVDNGGIKYVSSDALPLPLAELSAGRPPSSQLPFAFTRRLGTIGGNDSDDDSDNPPAPARRMDGAMGWLDMYRLPARSVSDCKSWWRHGHIVNNDYAVIRDDVVTLRNCYRSSIKGFLPLDNAMSAWRTDTVLLHQCNAVVIKGFELLRACTSAATTRTITYKSCARVDTQAVVRLHHCKTQKLEPTITFKSCTEHGATSRLINHSLEIKTQPTVPVPCRYYPIDDTTTTPDKPRSCRIRPPSLQLPLTLKRRRGKLPSSALPLALMCWHDEPLPHIPSLRSYLVHNNITATIGGIAVDPLSFDISTDKSSYCWSGSIDITPSDYQKIKHKLDVERGNEPMINVVINGKTFSIIAEKQSRNRQFANHSHTLSGRSITARLGADYAKPQDGLLDQDNYASQIVNQQLNGTGITVDRWEIADWFIPANTYAVSGKTPIAVIADIAAAAGGFVMSHPSQATISILSRWKAPAWELATTNPDAIIPVDVARTISDEKNVNPRYNTVTLNSNIDGGIVYRQQQSRDLDAPVQQHPLYTDRDCIIPAGIAVLSDSGTHVNYTLDMRWADKYNTPLAEPGQIWQINDPEGYWRGNIDSIAVSVKPDNDAPTIWQTVTIDRYLDA